MNNSKWSYLAGLVDGDGSIFISHRKHELGKLHGEYRLVLSVSNSNQDLLNVLEDQYSRNLVHFKSKNYSAGRISWEGPKAKAIIKKILKHLIAKREQAELALTFPCNGRGCAGIPKPALEIIRKRKFNICQNMRKLNKRWSKGKAWRNI